MNLTIRVVSVPSQYILTCSYSLSWKSVLVLLVFSWWWSLILINSFFGWLWVPSLVLISWILWLVIHKGYKSFGCNFFLNDILGVQDDFISSVSFLLYGNCSMHMIIISSRISLDIFAFFSLHCFSNILIAVTISTAPWFWQP